MFDANTFYPHPLSLCFLESLLPQAIQAAPILLAGGSPLLAHNILALVSFPLTGLGAFLLARNWALRAAARSWAAWVMPSAPTVSNTSCISRACRSSGCRWPSFLCGARLSTAGGAITCWPRCSLSFKRRAADITRSPWLSLSASSWLHGRESLRRGTFIPLLVALAVAAAVSGLAFVPHRLALKQQEALRGRPMTRSLAEVQRWSAPWSSYANPGPYVALAHQRALRATTGGSEPLYPTLVIGVLALAALATRPRAEAVRLAALLTLVGVLFSLGPRISLGTIVIPGPFEAIRRLPAVSMMRTPSRFGVLGLLGLSLLAALGWTHISRALRFGSWLAGAAAALFIVEAYPAGISAAIRPIAPPPPTVGWLAEAPRGPVLEAALGPRDLRERGDVRPLVDPRPGSACPRAAPEAARSRRSDPAP